MPSWLLAVALAGSAAALVGGYWDDAWHTERGRDQFLIAPHLAIYGGVAAIGAALALWVALAVRRSGVRAALDDRPLRLAVLGVGATLASGPIDSAWHEAFGRDAVIWSPPHMLGIVGTLALGAALLTQLGERRGLAALAGGLLLVAATFPAVEYDTDVPQFDAAWYLPVLVVGAAVGLAVVRLTVDGRWAGTAAAVAHLVILVAVSGFLLLVEFAPPALPLLIFPAAALDSAARRGWGPVARGIALTTATYLIYLPTRNLLGSGVEIDSADVLLGFPLAVVGASFVLALAGGTEAPRRARRAGAAATAAALLLAAAGPAAAHDPGQGADAGTAQLTVTVHRQRAVLAGRLREARCSLDGGEVVARRAGMIRRAPLVTRGCAFRGAIHLPQRGRWFVYAQLRRDGRTLETWLPARAGGGGERVSENRRYVYEPPGPSSGVVKLLAGGALYGATAALLVATFFLLGAGRRRRATRG